MVLPLEEGGGGGGANWSFTGGKEVKKSSTSQVRARCLTLVPHGRQAKLLITEAGHGIYLVKMESVQI